MVPNCPLRWWSGCTALRKESHGVVDMDAFERMLTCLVGGGSGGGGGAAGAGGRQGRRRRGKDVDSPQEPSPTTHRTGPSRWRQHAVRLGLREVVELPAAADVIKAAKAQAEAEAAHASPAPRRRDGSSTASSSVKGSPRRQRTLVDQRTTYADLAEDGAPTSAEAEERRPSSAFRRISIRSPSASTRGSLVALNRPMANQASWYRLGTPTAYPSEEPPAPHAHPRRRACPPRRSLLFLRAAARTNPRGAWSCAEPE